MGRALGAGACNERGVVWRDGGNTWILELTAYTEMPWYVGGEAELELAVELSSYTASGDFEIIVVARLSCGQHELASRYLGALAASNRRLVERVGSVVSPITFSRDYASPATENLTITIEGYISNRLYTYTLNLPVVVLAQSPDVDVRILINGTSDYYVSAEGVARLSFAVVAANVGRDRILGGVVSPHLSATLVGEKPLEPTAPSAASVYEFSVLGDAINALIEDGVVQFSGGLLVLSEKGRKLLDSLREKRVG